LLADSDKEPAKANDYPSVKFNLLADLLMNRSSQTLHVVILTCGAFLAGISIWILSAQVIRSGVTALPVTSEAAIAATKLQGRALQAARIGVLRGELWSELAYTYAALEWTKAPTPAGSPDGARRGAEAAVKLKPVNPAVWLFLADLAIRYQWTDPNPVESLKMSYYTGAHEDDLIPQRLLVASRFDTSADPELDRLFRRDIEYVLSYRPNLKSAISGAYGQASAQAQQAIQSEANDIDPAFAKTLQAPTPR
jgi:hypothetical protein